MKRKNVLDLLAAARPADLDLPGLARVQAEELPAPARRGRVRWLGVVAASLATASLIGVTALPRLLGTEIAAGRVATPNAGNALDAAADRASEQHQVPGRYWYTQGWILDEVVIGPPGGRYRIKTRVQTSRWVPRDPASFLVLTERGLPTVPVSPPDEQAWQRAGKPKLCGADTDCGNDTAPLGRTRFMFMPSTWPQRDLGLPLSARELLDLPQEPDALRERLLSYWPAYSDGMGAWPSPPAGASLPTKDSWLRGLSLELLQHAPMAPGTRAALYRVVAGLPGARALGRIRDAEGRWGVGIGWTRTEGDGQSEEQLVVEESSGALLSLQSVVVKPWSQDPPGMEGLAGETPEAVPSAEREPPARLRRVGPGASSSRPPPLAVRLTPSGSSRPGRAAGAGPAIAVGDVRKPVSVP
ncbi:CU044_5270 family protein [Nonomuraea rhodomycinica]|uniref:CU044_5270 family protein n=1 Tax=Nonomuraea rhodomycinica TaxID=1712872 RepID=A0A7Y6MDS6_9ACTN|nr:CU044_5270 family protein [Nonomuraea rhodomycinica]NUW42934.1 CU044_5270 family protein [Nonomuraea rhodomycinica]